MRMEGNIRTILLLVCAALGSVFQGCYSRPNNADLIPINPMPAGTQDPFTVFVATNREEGAGDEPYFTRERSKKTRYAKFDISVPEAHETGKFETPRNRKRARPDKHFYATSSVMLNDEATFRRQLRAHVESNTKSKSVAIYVHGVFTRFPEGVFFTAQLNHDSKFEGTPLLFAWPTGGGWLDYVYDKDSATTSRDALQRTIQIAAESGAERIMIVAHSMGCLLTMETLRQAAIAGDATFGGKLNCVILASSDIAVDVFEAQVERMGTPPLMPRIGVLTSHDDKLLKLSTRIARGGDRVGRSEDNERLLGLGVDVFDITEYTSRGVSTHYKFAATPESLVGIYGIMLNNLQNSSAPAVYPIDSDGEVLDLTSPSQRSNWFGLDEIPFGRWGD